MDAKEYKCTNKWIHSYRKDRCMNSWAQECIGLGVNGCVYKKAFRSMYANGCQNICERRWIDTWPFGPMVSWTHGCKDAQLHRCIDAWVNS
jgi:hypothetical protein